jgi:PAS domain S-box-containing protein
MNSVAKNLVEEFSTALRAYLAGEGEAALGRAYEAGRSALAEGLGVLEVVAAHQESVIRVLQSQVHEPDKERIFEHAWSCLSESLSPFEMVLRGVQEANTRLQESLNSLESVEQQLLRQNAVLVTAQKRLERERSRYQALFDFAPDGYLVTGVEGAILEVNSAAAAILRTTKELLPGQSLHEFVVKADREEFRERLRALHLGMIERVEDWQIGVQPQQGSPIPAAITVVAERSAPSTASLRWLIRDVTERKRLEKERARWLVGRARAKAAQRFKFLAAASSLLVGSFDVETSLIRVCRLTTSFLAGWCFASVVEPDGSVRQLEVTHADPSFVELAKGLRRYCLFGGMTHADHGRLLAGPGVVEQLTGEWCDRAAEGPEHARLLRQLDGSSAMVLPILIRGRLVGVLTLISALGVRPYGRADRALGEDLARRCALALENARLYREVVAERDKAERASRAKGEFVAILGHELRNPLTPVLGWTRILKNHTLISQDPTLAEGVRAMEKNAMALTRLVGECVDLTKISEGKIQIERMPVDLNQIVRASVESVRGMASERGVSVDTQMTPDPLLMMGDAMRLEQVVMNLLVNAVKYTGSGGLISICTMSIGGESQVEVKDTGIGIDPAFLPHIFEPFRQGTSSWLTSESGLGLGLAIARQIVGMHGGRVWAESPGLGCGSTFRVRLPMGTEADAKTPTETAEQLAGQESALRILLIEDSHDILFLMKTELTKLGHTVVTATNGQLGMEAALAHSPDLIISDIKMPVVDGYELIRNLRGAPDLSHTPAIALTGFGSKADSERALAAGFNACLSKPAEPAEIAALIRLLTEKKHAISAGPHPG